MRKPNAIFVLAPEAYAAVYGARERAEIADRVNLYASPQTRDSVAAHPQVLADAELIFSGRGAPVLGEDFLDAAPALKAFYYGAGAAGSILTPSVWKRGIIVTSAINANAVPVAEYTLSTIIFSLKHGWRLIRETRESRTFGDRDTGVPGCYGSTVGLISVGSIARALLKLLKPFDLKVLAYDPFLNRDEASRLGIDQLVGLEELFEGSDVVSLHAPHLPETTNLITGRHLASMKFGATFINTARGEIVAEPEMIEVARSRPDLQFVLDVTTPEPPTADSLLYTLPNLVLTPHMAGSAGAERQRMGRYMIEELDRYLEGRPLQWAVTPEMAKSTSHRPVEQNQRNNMASQSKLSAAR